MEVDEPIIGFLVITIFLPRRRWYGRMKSLVTVESGVELSNYSEVRHMLLQGYINPQPMYYEHKIPASIFSHAP